MSRIPRLIAVSLLAAAPGARAAPPCADAVALADDGTIAQWHVCRGSARQTFVAPGGARLALGVSVDGKAVGEGSTWERQKPHPGRWRFRAVGLEYPLDVVREYRRVDASALEHAIAVTNASGRVLRDVVLTLDLGGALPPDHAATGALADVFYGFHRALVRDDGGEWRIAEPGRQTKAFAVVARHKALIVESADGLAVVDSSQGATRAGPRGGDVARDGSSPLRLAIAIAELRAGETAVFRQRISALPTETRVLSAAGYAGLTYAHLPAPIARLSAALERALDGLSSIAGPGLAVILLAVGVRIVTLPASLWSARRQRKFASISERMKPGIARVRARYKGAEQSERILRIYKENGVTPLTGLKGSLGLFLQIPFLLAVFNVTTLSSSLYAEPFLWIEDLSLPDAAAPLPASVALLGGHVNVLPIAMGALFLLASPTATERGAGRGFGSALVTLLIVALVYSFASALLLYWLAANAFQAGERFLFRRAPFVGGDP